MKNRPSIMLLATFFCTLCHTAQQPFLSIPDIPVGPDQDLLLRACGNRPYTDRDYWETIVQCLERHPDTTCRIEQKARKKLLPAHLQRIHDLLKGPSKKNLTLEQWESWSAYMNVIIERIKLRIVHKQSLQEEIHYLDLLKSVHDVLTLHAHPTIKEEIQTLEDTIKQQECSIIKRSTQTMIRNLAMHRRTANNLITQGKRS